MVHVRHGRELRPYGMIFFCTFWYFKLSFNNSELDGLCVIWGYIYFPKMFIVFILESTNYVCINILWKTYSSSCAMWGAVCIWADEHRANLDNTLLDIVCGAQSSQADWSSYLHLAKSWSYQVTVSLKFK